MSRIHPFVLLPLSFLFVVATHANEKGKDQPFTLTEEQRAAVAKAIADDPGKLPRVIAEELSAPEAAVVEALPDAMRLGIDPSQFEKVWDELVTWEKPLLILRAAGSVFQIKGSVAPGKFGKVGEEYYSIDVDWSPWGGHLKPSELAAIYLIKKPFRGRDTWQCAFYDKAGKRAFAVYVDRDDDFKPNAETLAAFKRMWKKFEKSG